MQATNSQKQNSEKLTILEDLYQEGRGSQVLDSPRAKTDSSSKVSQNIKDIFADDKRAERFLAWTTLVLGTCALIFGVFYFRQSLNTAVAQPDDLATELAQRYQPEELDAALAELAAQDTDGDGLNDYDELYTYSTSPFLEDTDSDGVLDSAELTNRTNPNCAYEKNCENNQILLALPEPETSEEATELPTLGDIVIEGQITPDKVRQVLRTIGVTDAQLSQLSDVQVLLVYQELLSRVSGVDIPTAIEGQRQIESIKALEDLQTDEIRQLLLNNGISQESLNLISDEELRLLISESSDIQ